MKLQHKDYVTLLSNEEDQDILTRRLFDVNLRLMKTSSQYRKIVLDCAEYIRWCSITEKEGYKKPHGFSGANGGIPFNIIAVGDQILINPKIIAANGEAIGMSNCGSLLLDKPIMIKRFRHVVVDYYNLQLERCQVNGYLPTHQHEIDHNKGILITDRRV